jgi:hypothetical protein
MVMAEAAAFRVVGGARLYDAWGRVYLQEDSELVERVRNSTLQRRGSKLFFPAVKSSIVSVAARAYSTIGRRRVALQLSEP